ncbi:MAG: hypothetical protein ACFE8E_02470 [Candidatus Hodarchaeota archaeon]
MIRSDFKSKNFNEIPPIIGIIVANQYGNTLMVFEYNLKEESNYKPIKAYITEDTKKLLEVDLISMYFSSFKIFATQTNIQNLSHLMIYGSNIKIQINFLLDKYMIILFLNSYTSLNSNEKDYIMSYFNQILIKYNYEFNNFNTSNSTATLKNLEKKGKKWLESLNRNYILTYTNLYMRKHHIIEKFIKKLGPIIESNLIEYLEHIPEEILNNLTKELKNKIQDQLFEFSLK